MNLRNRLSLITTLTFGIVFTITSSAVYVVFKKSTERVIFNELENSVLITAYFYLEEDELSSNEHGEIRKQFKENTQGIEVRIYNEKNKIKFGDFSEDKEISSEILNKIREEKTLNFASSNHFYSALFYPDNQGDFVVLLKERKDTFSEQSNRLLLILVMVLIAGILAIFFLSRWVSNIAYKPVTKVISNLNSFDLNKIDQPITKTKTDNELDNLIETFNQLLARISDSILIQKNFINYVSHEFKTPLASISGNLEVFGQKNRTPEEYKEVSEKVLKNVYQIEDILNTLLVVSGIKSNQNLISKTRTDELIWQVLEKLNESGFNTKNISVLVETPKSELLETKVDKNQLFVALFNLVENAIKYGEDKPIEIKFNTNAKQKLTISISDNGNGIPADELDKIFKPFYRGNNAEKYKGTGLGLSLTQLICKQNNIILTVKSNEKGTSFLLQFS
jgi:two-component system sensor histidine kinase ArlS